VQARRSATCLTYFNMLEYNSYKLRLKGCTLANAPPPHSPYDAVYLWETATGRLIRILEGRTKGVNGMSFSSDGRLIASSGVDETVRVWGIP